MSSSRIVGASLLGGVVMFGWGAAAHMALPIGDMGVKSLPGEQLISPAMKFSIKERGFYMFPGTGEGEVTEEAMRAWEEQYRQGPRGILVFDPSGGEVMSGAQLGTEFASNVIAALFAAIILARVGGSVGYKALLAACFGVIAWLSIVVSYCSWYRFPIDFAVGQLLEMVIGWFLCGAAIGLVLGRGNKPAVAG